MPDTKLLRLNYYQDSTERYGNFKHLPGFVLLHSADKKLARYDILSACPYDEIQVERGADDWGEALNRLEQVSQGCLSDLKLPFQGGAIGYISYDFTEGLFDLPSKPSLMKHFKSLWFGVYDWGLVVDHIEKQVYLFATEHSSKKQAWLEDMKSLWHQPPPLCEAVHLSQNFRKLISRKEYESAFEHIMSGLKQGRCYQVNYTQPFEGKLQGDPWCFYQKIIKQNPVPYAAFLSLKDYHVLSFSPERNVLWDGARLLSSPIKGTIRRSTDPHLDAILKEQLKNCPKNRAENVMIVDLVRNDLGQMAQPGSVEVSSLCEIQSFEGVHHLVSHVHAQGVEGLTPLQALINCFPGGSITGAPKRETMKIIHELEPYARGVYCGSVAYLSHHGRMDSNIAIRTITEQDQRLILSAGGGVVIDSECDSEYRECLTKISAIAYAMDNE